MPPAKHFGSASFLNYKTGGRKKQYGECVAGYSPFFVPGFGFCSHKTRLSKAFSLVPAWMPEKLHVNTFALCANVKLK